MCTNDRFSAPEKYLKHRNAPKNVKLKVVAIVTS